MNHLIYKCHKQEFYSSCFDRTLIIFSSILLRKTILWLLIQSLIVNYPNSAVLSLTFLCCLFYSGFLIMSMVELILVYEASTFWNSTSKRLRLPLVIRMLIVEFLCSFMSSSFSLLKFVRLSLFVSFFPCFVLSTRSYCLLHEVRSKYL